VTFKTSSPIKKMNSHIDFRTLPNNVPSLCIPRVFSNWTETRIRRIFDDLNMGEIQRIDVISKTTEKGEKFNRVFVHFKRWFSNENSDMARERLLNGKEIKIVYDDPWFWKVSAYRETSRDTSKKNEHHSDKEQRPRATIKFDDDKAQSVSVSDRSVSDRRTSVSDRSVSDRRTSVSDRRPSASVSDRRPIASSRSYDHHRPKDEPRDRRDRPRDQDRKNTKEVVDKHLDEVNKAIGNIGAISPPAESLVQETDVRTSVGGIVYDMDVINSAKPRKIVIKKEPVVQKAPLKIEIEEGEVEEGEVSDGDYGDGADGDGLANVRW
jgi:hypothetical protein